MLNGTEESLQARAERAANPTTVVSVNRFENSQHHLLLSIHTYGRRQKLVPVPFRKDENETLFRFVSFQSFFRKTLYRLNCVNIKEFQSPSLIKLKCDIDAVSIKN